MYRFKIMKIIVFMTTNLRLIFGVYSHPNQIKYLNPCTKASVFGVVYHQGYCCYTYTVEPLFNK
jgi:hypothetical protein